MSQFEIRKGIFFIATTNDIFFSKSQNKTQPSS